MKTTYTVRRSNAPGSTKRIVERDGMATALFDTEADALLFAAAPDLLAACLAWRESKSDEDEDAACKACEAAIAKATGAPI